MATDNPGADKMRAIARELRDLGDKALKREFGKALTAAATPLKNDLPASARTVLPRRGGLGNRVAKAQIRIARKADGSVRVTARQQYQIGRMDSPGVVRHPVFKRKGEQGRRTVWQSQRIRPGWFTRPAERRAPMIRRAMLEAADDMGKRIDGVRDGGFG